MNTSQNDLQAWIGRSETVRDTIGATPVKALDATLDHPARPIELGTLLPPLWHWLYFLPLHRQSEIGPDPSPCMAKANSASPEAYPSVSRIRQSDRTSSASSAPPCARGTAYFSHPADPSCAT